MSATGRTPAHEHLHGTPGGISRAGALFRFGVAVAAVVCAIGLRLALNPVLGAHSPYLPFILAVMVAARVGGRRTGFTATALSVLGIAWFLLEPRHSFAVADPFAMWGLALFVVVGSLMSLLIGDLRRLLLSVAAQSEEAIREQCELTQASEERFRGLVKASSEVLYRMSPDWSEIRELELGTTDFISDAGNSGKDWLQRYIHPDDQPRVLEAIQKAVRTKSVFQLELRVRRVDGSLGWALSRAVPVLDTNGEITEWFGAASDVTARKRAEFALHESEERLRLLVENVREYALFQTDPEGRVISWNPGAERMFGYPRADILGRSVACLLTPEDQAANLAGKEMVRVSAGERNEDARWLVRRDGTRFWARWVSEPQRDETGRFRGVVTVLRDETERRRAEEGLRQVQKLESIGLLAGGVAHDFNNLLTVIMASASAGLMQCPSCGHSQAILDASERASYLTKQLLAYAGKGQFVTKTFDLTELVSKSMPLLSASVPKRVIVVFNLSEQLPLIDADPSQIEQVLMNLVINAGEAIPLKTDGRIEIATSSCEVTPETAIRHPHEVQPGSHVLLEVRDNGAGMDEATVSRIFDPFFSTKFTGRGLGLAAVHGIVRSSRGFIEVNTSPGVGSIFRVFLPALPQQRSAEPISEPPATVPRQTYSASAILVVDDEEMVRKLASVTLRGHGYHVLEATDGRDALKLLAHVASLPALVLLDLAMPGMGGEELIPILEHRYPRLKVLVSSAYTEEDARKSCSSGSVVGFLQKPYTVFALLEMVRESIPGTGAAPDSRIIEFPKSG